MKHSFLFITEMSHNLYFVYLNTQSIIIL